MPSIRIEIQGQSFDAPLPNAPVRVGKNADADLCIQGDGVAGEHCVLEPLVDGRFKLRDAGSGYDTKVNGFAVKQVSLSDGDLIEVGDARITYLAAGAAAPAAPAAAAAAARPARPAQPAKAAKPAQAAKPARAAKPAPAVASPAKAAPDDTSSATEAPADVIADAAPATPAETTDPAKAAAADMQRGTRAKPTSKVPVLGLAAGALVLAVIVFAVGGLGGSDASSYESRYAAAQRLYDLQDFEGAKEIWAKIAADKAAGPLQERAADGLANVGAVEREMAARLEKVWSERLDMTSGALGVARRRFLESYGHTHVQDFDTLRGRVLAAQGQWKREELAKTQEEADEHTRLAFFAKARAVWKRLSNAAPMGVDVLVDVDAALRQLEADADVKATSVADQARAWNKAGLTFRSRQLLSDMMPRFEGMAAEATLKKALKETLIEHAKPVEITPYKPSPGDTQPKKPTKSEPAAPTSEDERKALLARAEALVAKAKERIQARRFGDAAEILRKDVGSFPMGPVRTMLAGSAADLELAEDGLGRLIAHINASPERYRGVRIAPRLKVSVTAADRDTLSAKISGGHSKHHWSRLSVSAFPKLIMRMSPGKASAIPTAALMHVVGSHEAAERALFLASKAGCATSDLFPVLARWRKESVPDGGYVEYENRYVTPAEREHLVREAKITAAIQKMDARELAERQAAYEELLGIGEPAVERFQGALNRRRAYLADELVRSKTFTGGKYKAKLLALLDQRRKHALALIYDAAAYPYPNPQKKNQKEVEARVDAVREVWERPFDLVAQWDKKLTERLSGITEVDEVLARIDAGYAPDLDEIKARINKAIDIPSSSDPSIRPYSLSVRVFNTTLSTTATGMEKENVRSVNDYRMMMGLAAVRIHEKLTRAARGHSRHMSQNGYFAHNVPGPYATPTNRSPGSRAKHQGYGGGVGENIARGPWTGHGAFMAWFRSSGHHRNMLGRGWFVMGCGRADGTWWTQLFGGGSKSLKDPDPLPAPSAEFAPDKEDAKGRPQKPGTSEVPDEAPPGDPMRPGPDDGPSDPPK